MAQPANPVWQYDDTSKAAEYSQPLSSGAVYYHGSLASSDPGGGSPHKGAAEFSQARAVVLQEHRSLVEDVTDVSWEEGPPRDFEEPTAASPPPKRKRQVQPVFEGIIKANALADYALVQRDLGPCQHAWCYQGKDNSMQAEDVRDRAQAILMDQQAVAFTRPASARRYPILHHIAMALTFMAIVSLWGMVDMAVEVLSGVSNGLQFQLYALILTFGALSTLGLRKLKALAYRGTFYPALLSSLLTMVGGWGLVDVAVEAFSGSNQKMMLFSYFNVFFAAGLLVTLHVLFVDRTFSEVLGRLI